MENNTVKQLKDLAREQGIIGYSRMKKAQLIEALGNIDTTPLNEPIPKIDKKIKNKYDCVHGKYKYYCKKCQRYRICSHNRRKDRINLSSWAQLTM